MVEWVKTSEHAPPKDRLILITSGIAWRREDEIIPEREVRGRSPHNCSKTRTHPARHYKHRREVGGVCIVYWGSPQQTGQKEGVWLSFGTGKLGPQQFDYWMEFVNPISASLPDSYHGTDVPDIESLTVHVPSDEEIRAREVRNALGG